MQEDKNKLSEHINKYLQDNSISLRKFSQSVDIDASTISRIMNNKQQPTLNHLTKISNKLNLPIDKLLYDSDNIIDSESDINSVLECSNIDTLDVIIKNVRNELLKYEEYVKTDEGRQIVLDQFEEKINSLNATGPMIDSLKDLYEIFLQEKINSDKYVYCGSAILYFILSVDVIPDYLFGIGYLDDIIAIKFVYQKINEK